ncbi:hypothetical protein DXG01_006450 [Tephrocybe rancida]|nr:hypothetical protein DXG01_006450 [Tephrocybe rancida]
MRDPSSFNWARFLDHALLVHSLNVREKRKYRSVMNFVSKKNSVVDVFPNLQSLTCTPKHYEQKLAMYRPFISSKIQRLIIDVAFFESHVSTVHLLPLSSPLLHIDNLVCLEIRAYRLTDLPAFVRQFQKLPRLETVILPIHSMTVDVIEALSELPNLRELKSNDSGMVKQNWCNQVHHIPNFKSDAFPKLKVFTFSGCSVDLSTVVRHRHFPTTIESFAFQTLYCEDGSVVAPPLKVLAERCTQIRECAFREVSVCLPDILPFLSARLTSLRIDSYYLLDFTDDELEDLARALPSIEILYLNEQPIAGGHENSIGPNDVIKYRAVPLYTTPVFSWHCPCLRVFGAVFDADYPEEDWEIYEQNDPWLGLVELDVGMSLLKAEDVGRVAMFLARFLPPFARIVTAEESSARNAWSDVSCTISFIRQRANTT